MILMFVIVCHCCRVMLVIGIVHPHSEDFNDNHQLKGLFQDPPTGIPGSSHVSHSFPFHGLLWKFTPGCCPWSNTCTLAHLTHGQSLVECYAVSAFKMRSVGPTQKHPHHPSVYGDRFQTSKGILYKGINPPIVAIHNCLSSYWAAKPDVTKTRFHGCLGPDRSSVAMRSGGHLAVKRKDR